jgi:hypothetical protein
VSAMSKKVAISVHCALRLMALLFLIELVSIIHMAVVSDTTGLGLAWNLAGDIAETLVYIILTGTLFGFIFYSYSKHRY